MKNIIFGGGKYGYRDLPKTASTSIKAAIYQMEVNEVFCRKKEGMHVHLYMDRHRKGDVSLCEKRFVVVRDPVERFLSAYSNRVIFHEELSEPFIKNNFPNYYYDIPYFTPGLGQFLGYLEDYLLIKPIFHHFRPIADFFGNQRLESFTNIYKIEDLSRFEEDLSELTGKEVAFEHRQTGGRKYFLRDLTKKQLEKLIQFYKKDYELLEGFYTVDDLWNIWKGDEHDADVPRAAATKNLFRIAVDKFKSSK